MQNDSIISNNESAATSEIEFPKAILHFDGDAFFASVEQMMDYRLRNKPVITGGERGAATSLSYEAKAFGLSRGMRLSEIKARCPEAIIVPSDYVSYGLFAHRMYTIVRSYAPLVEEYSIDECFADITGLDRQYGISYGALALRIKAELEDSLGITFGVGLGPSKTLAKVASKAHKPAGFTSIPMSKITEFLEPMNIYNVWGLGGASGTHLTKLGADTAGKFIRQSDEWLAEHHFGKAYRDIWLELQGKHIKKLTLVQGPPVSSIMSTRTFKPPSTSRSFIFSQLSKNVEHVCEKARNHDLQAQGLSFYLKTQEFTYHSVSLELTVPIISPSEILKFIVAHFDEVYAPNILYRASGITIRSLRSNKAFVPDLFGERVEQEEKRNIFMTLDGVNKKYGKQTIFLASSLQAVNHREPRREGREKYALTIEQKRKTLGLPYLGIVK
jgi:DNA polymerase-4